MILYENIRTYFKNLGSLNLLRNNIFKSKMVAKYFALCQN